MSGEKNLKTLLGTLRAKLHEGIYVFTTIPADQVPKNIVSRMFFQEDEGITLILLKDEALAHDLSFEFESKMITLDVHSSLEAVGFMAVISTELAKKNMGVNPVSGFYHDHIFVPNGREVEAMKVLEKIASENKK